MSKVTIDFLVRHYSCYDGVFFVDIWKTMNIDIFLINTIGGIEWRLIMVYETFLLSRCFLTFIEKL